MKLINSQKTTQQQKAIASFFEDNKFIASDIAKGYSSDYYAWIADFIHKSPLNNTMNPHSCYISFFSDQEIFYQEFGNVTRIYENYDFFSLIQRQKFAPNTFELTKKQYSIISNKGSESDMIEYFNVSDKQRVSIDEKTTIFDYKHEFWRAPAFCVSGYLIHLDDADNTGALGKAKFYDRYYFAYPWSITNTLELNKASVDINAYQEDLFDPNEAHYEIFQHIFTGDPSTIDIVRLFDVKINICNPRYAYFTQQNEWIDYYNDTIHYYNQGYTPYYGVVNFYETDENHPEKWQSIYPEEWNSFVMFFPNIIRNGIFEPAKVIANWGSRMGEPHLRSGQMTFNSGSIPDEINDQSRIVYNVCKHMLNKPDAGEPFAPPGSASHQFIVHKKVDGKYLYSGIDIDTERNRRHSAVVMTEPYFTTVPMCGGEVVGYMFVNSNGDPVKFASESDFYNNPDIFLKIKSSKNMINEIDKLIQLEDYNTDIIETFTINDPLNKYNYILTESDYYNKFGGSIDNFFKRQDDCVDDLIGRDIVTPTTTTITTSAPVTIPTTSTLGIVGQGNHSVYRLPISISKYADKYTSTPITTPDAVIKINGLGFISKTITNGLEISVKNYLNIYCSNYYPINAPKALEGGGMDPIANNEYDFTTALTRTGIYSSRQYEKIYPMIKLSGINGYIKIVEKNNSFRTSRSKDGGYETIYNIEFPYCPGSYTERLLSNFSDYKETWILKKLSYIPAGSWEAFGSGNAKRYNKANSRHVPFADDSFGMHNILTQYADSGIIKTLPYNSGGGMNNIIETQKNFIVYPASLVWVNNQFALIAITKPGKDLSEFRKYGTYDIRVLEDNEEQYFSKDIKVVGLIDNRKWKFAESRLLSYINNENPSYICEINTSALFNNFTLQQKDNASIPDMKRWLCGMFSGFANSMVNATPDLNTENINTILNNDLTSLDSSSDIVIEMWDNKSKLDVIRGENWRPVSPVNSNTDKVAGLHILDYLYVDKGSLQPESALFEDVLIYSVQLKYLKDLHQKIPDYVHFGEPNDIINGKSNLVLFDTRLNKTYHICYIKAEALDYKAYIYYNPATMGVMPSIDSGNIEASDYGQFAICYPQKQMNKNTSFQLYTSLVVQGIAGNLISRYIDIRSNISNIEGAPTDLERFIDENKKIYLRIRVLKRKKYPISYTNDNESTIQYLWGNEEVEAEAVNKWMNFPWASYDGEIVTFDEGFDFEKNIILEVTRRFGMTYFKFVSK